MWVYIDVVCIYTYKGVHAVWPNDIDARAKYPDAGLFAGHGEQLGGHTFARPRATDFDPYGVLYHFGRSPPRGSRLKRRRRCAPLRLHARCLSPPSNLLHLLVAREMIPRKYHHRLIFGFSTGTLDDTVAKAFESGTAPVSKRLESLHWLQDKEFRTFGMICPSLPQDDYERFSREICAAIRVEKCEHVWAEPINVRGESLSKTLAALRAAGLDSEACRLAAVSGAGNGKAWEDYSRQTFLAHSNNIEPGKLRFLQYIDARSADWWAARRCLGAVLLGKTAKARGLTAV